MTSLGDSQKNYIRSILEENYQQSNIGDINDDSLINVQDIIILVNIILNDEFENTADLNYDSSVDILDIIELINIIF